MQPALQVMQVHLVQTLVEGAVMAGALMVTIVVLKTPGRHSLNLMSTFVLTYLLVQGALFPLSGWLLHCATRRDPDHGHGDV